MGAIEVMRALKDGEQHGKLPTHHTVSLRISRQLRVQPPTVNDPMRPAPCGCDVTGNCAAQCVCRNKNGQDEEPEKHPDRFDHTAATSWAWLLRMLRPSIARPSRASIH